MNHMKYDIEKLQELAVVYGLKVLSVIAILIIGRILAGYLKKLIIKVMRKGKVDETLVTFLGNLAYAVMLVFVVITAISQLGIQTTSFVAVLGAAGLAVGLALQGSLSNFASGVLMIIFKPFGVGDYIEGGGMSGTVEEISIFTTQLKSPDNKKIIVPNSKMMGDSIVNYNANGTRRIDLTVNVSYTENLENVKKTLEEILKLDSRILPEPAPLIGVGELAPAGVKINVYPWVNTADYLSVMMSLQENIKNTFEAKKIQLPSPIHDIHLYNKA